MECGDDYNGWKNFRKQIGDNPEEAEFLEKLQASFTYNSRTEFDSKVNNRIWKQKKYKLEIIYKISDNNFNINEMQWRR